MRKLIIIAVTCALVAPAVSAGADSFTLRQLPSATSGELRRGAVDENPAMGMDVGGGAESKSSGKAFLYSLLLPGAGHQYVGYRGTATGFYITEAAIWASFLTFKLQQNHREDGYENYAASLAGVSPTGHSKDYYEVIGEYSSSAQYEAEIKSEGRLRNYPNINNQQLEDYFAANRVGDYEPWAWASEDARFLYRNKRFSAKRAQRRATWALWSAAANRVISAVFAVKAARDYNERMGEQAYRIEIGPPRYHADDAFQTGISLVGRF